ncbi:MAG: hypothetical protein ACYC3X_26655, partial [Pirellulaceae bacterium]
MAKRNSKSKRPQPQHKKRKKSQHDGLNSVGRTSQKLATVVLGLLVQKFAPGLLDRITVGMDDSPTSRYGKHVEGAGIHHHPTPGPADGEWLYGHNWVTLAWLATHPVWG